MDQEGNGRERDELRVKEAIGNWHCGGDGFVSSGVFQMSNVAGGESQDNGNREGQRNGRQYEPKF
jgi:hypothetical protein